MKGTLDGAKRIHRLNSLILCFHMGSVFLSIYNLKVILMLNKLIAAVSRVRGYTTGIKGCVETILSKAHNLQWGLQKHKYKEEVIIKKI